MLPVVVLATCLSAAASAVPFQVGPDASLELNVLVQAHARFAGGEASDGTSWSRDLFLRRVRVILSGTVFERFSFFVDTEQPNWGRGGDWGVRTFLSDAFGTIRIADAFLIDIGMMLMPISRHGFSSAVSLNALDFHLGMLRYVPGAHKNLRDAGLQFRGALVRGRFLYRAGIFNGSQGVVLQRDTAGAPLRDADGRVVLASNPDDWPRFAGHLRWVITGWEKGFFAGGMTFCEGPTVSIGAGFEYLHDAAMDRPAQLGDDAAVVTPGRLRGAWSLSADVHADLPLGKGSDHEIVAMAAFVMYDHGNELAWNAAGVASLVPSENSGLGVWAELGYRWRIIGPFLSIDWFRGERANNDLLAVRGGFAWWIRGHTINLKAEFGGQRCGDLDTAPWKEAFLTQLQLFF